MMFHMPETSFFNKRMFVVGTIALACILVGATIEMFADPVLPPFLSNSKKGYHAGFIAAQTLVEKSSIGKFLVTPDDVRILSEALADLQAILGGAL